MQSCHADSLPPSITSCWSDESDLLFYYFHIACSDDDGVSYEVLYVIPILFYSPQYIRTEEVEKLSIKLEQALLDLRDAITLNFPSLLPLVHTLSEELRHERALAHQQKVSSSQQPLPSLMCLVWLWCVGMCGGEGGVYSQRSTLYNSLTLYLWGALSFLAGGSCCETLRPATRCRKAPEHFLSQSYPSR